MKLGGLINKVYGSINQVYEVSGLINLVYEAVDGYKPSLWIHKPGLMSS